jgi:hypothetical protein
MAYLGLIYAKKPPLKISRLLTFKQQLAREMKRVQIRLQKTCGLVFSDEMLRRGVRSVGRACPSYGQLSLVTAQCHTVTARLKKKKTFINENVHTTR